MATAPKAKKSQLQGGSRSPNPDIYRIPVDVAPVRQQVGEDIMGWIAACVLIAVLLPLGAMLYIDILEAKHEVKEQVEKVEKLRRQIEQEKRKNDKT
jgi:hypothetical protein